MLAILLSLLPEVLGFFGKVLSSFIKNSQAAGLSPDVVAVIAGFVQSAEANAVLKTGDDKWQWVFDRAKEYFAHEGKIMADAMVNAAIEMAVQDLPSTLAKLSPKA